MGDYMREYSGLITGSLDYSSYHSEGLRKIALFGTLARALAEAAVDT